MDKRSALTSATVPITKFNARRLAAIFLLFILCLQAAACAKIDIIYPSEETATAIAKIQALTPTGSTDLNVSIVVSDPTSTQTLPPTQTATATVSPTATSTVTATLPPPTDTPSATQTAPSGTATTESASTVSVSETTTSGSAPQNGNQVSNPLSIISPPTMYYTQPGDTLEALCSRFGVEADQITSPDLTVIPAHTLLANKTLLVIPDVVGNTTAGDRLFPDSEIIFSPSAIGFDAASYVADAGGYLTQFKEWRTDGWYNGGEVIQRVAYENSVNPRLLLALVEYQTGWIFGPLDEDDDSMYPLGFVNTQYQNLYKQLTWSIMEVGIGYYGWRAGTLTDLTFPDGSTLRLAPELNAGTVAMMYLFSNLYNQSEWSEVLYGDNNFFELYNRMFDDAWMRAKTVEPFFPTDLEQPELLLPFEVGKTWTLTSGPHAVWGPEGVLGALDFAPPSMTAGCIPSEEWITAVASGVVTRSYNGAVVVDLDGDGYEQTGWSIFYMHVSHEGRVEVGDWVDVGDPIGHPSCEGGVSTGTHLHIARKYNGEWIPADGPLAFTLNGWTAHNGESPYKGTLTRGSQVITSDVNSSYISKVTREK